MGKKKISFLKSLYFCVELFREDNLALLKSPQKSGSLSVVEFFQQWRISVEICGHGSFWEVANCDFCTLLVYGSAKILLFWCGGPEIHFLQCCHTHVELQQLNMIVYQEPRSPTISLEELKFTIASRRAFLQQRWIGQVASTIRKMAEAERRAPS